LNPGELIQVGIARLDELGRAVVRKGLDMTIHNQARRPAVSPASFVDTTSDPPGPRSSPSRRLQRFTTCVGGFYLVMGGINIGLSIGRPGVYAAFADAALFDWVRDTWQTVFMAHPAVWAALLGGGEVLVGIALLSGRRWSMAGYLAVILFHLALMLFGWGVWLWAAPVLAVVVPSARAWARSLRRHHMCVSSRAA